MNQIQIPEQVRDRAAHGIEVEPYDIGWESEAIDTVSGQNSNNSVRITDEFYRRIDTDQDWHLVERTTGQIVKTVKARHAWNHLCLSAWASADPGIQNDDIIQMWHTCPNDGKINGSNPCSEYLFLDNTACNLASLRLTAFLGNDGDELDLGSYEHAARLWTIVLDISVSMASYPSLEVAEGSYNYRTLGLGYTDLGGLLMRMALPYDSDEGRALAAALTALMTGVAYRTSAEIAGELGPFPRWEANEHPFRAVMQKHYDAIPIPSRRTDHPKIWKRAKEAWEAVVAARSFRNAQATLIAPTGTISFVMDCDTTGIEPDYALVKHKNLAGGGSMRIVNRAIPDALRRLGTYDKQMIEKIVTTLETTGVLNLSAATDALVFACVADLEPMAHVKMVAAIQPFLSGAASKTINLPNSATVEDVSYVYRECHKLGVKAVALYRDASKLTQPLESAKSKLREDNPESAFQSNDTGAREKYGQLLHNAIAEAWKKNPPPDLSGLERGDREHLPARRRGFTDKARLGGQTFYLRTGEYEDGRLGEVFIDLAGAGSTLDGFANALAKMVSIALQFGAPLAEVVEALMGIRFEPSGFVELHDEIKQATSIPDFVGRDLAISYLDRQDLSQKVRMVAVETGEAIVALDRRAVVLAEGRPTGETCQCGGLLVQTGTCKTCLDCGTSSGGCG